MTTGPLTRLDEVLPAAVRRVVARETPIPTMAALAAARKEQDPTFVRADIGQVVGLEPELEVLYGPPVGLEPLRAAVAETYTRAFDLAGRLGPDLPDGLAARHVTLCTGAAEALSLLFRCFASGRTVALMRGHWENYANGVDLAEGRAVVVDPFDAEGRLDAEGLARALRDHDAAALVANFPCNPTGAVLDRDEMARLGQVARDTGVVVIADEVYARLRYDGVPPDTLLAHAPDHVVSIGSASKEYLLAGARVGCVVSAHAELTDRVLRKLVRANTASPNVPGQRMLLERLAADLEDLRAGRPPAVLTRIRDGLRRRRDGLAALLERHGLETVGRPGHRPEGTIFLTVGLPPWFVGDDRAFCRRAIEEGCVSAIPGSAFGIEGAVRLSFGALSEEDVARLDTRLADFRRAVEAVET